VLDAIGDLYLLGHPVLGRFVAHKSGHALNNRLARQLLSERSAWQFTTFERQEEAPAFVSHDVQFA
jgi:UDP-3-O-[3-hydroxymyristoyl] N-acetylglucosamine deacetylase